MVNIELGNIIFFGEGTNRQKLFYMLIENSYTFIGTQNILYRFKAFFI